MPQLNAQAETAIEPKDNTEELAALLIQKDDTETPKPAAAKAAEVKLVEEKPETPATDDATKVEPDAAAETAEKPGEEVKPGTPDKALQKMQQDLSAATRKIDELNEKVTAGEKLTPKETAQAQQAQRKIDSIKTALKGADFDVFENSKAVAESLVENDGDVQGLKKQVQQLSQTVETLASEKVWDGLAKQYPGVDLPTVWTKCVDDAGKVIGKDNPALANLASKYFHERADVAAKTIKTKAAPNKDAEKLKKPVTPGNTEVTVQTGAGSGQPSDADDYVNRAMALISKD